MVHQKKFTKLDIFGSTFKILTFQICFTKCKTSENDKWKQKSHSSREIISFTALCNIKKSKELPKKRFKKSKHLAQILHEQHKILHKWWLVCCTFLHICPSQARPGREHSRTWVYCDYITCRPEYGLHYAITSRRVHYLVLFHALQMKHRIREP